MKVLVTGGAGFVGSHLCGSLLEKEFEVVCMDTAPPRKVEHLSTSKGFRYVRDSILNKQTVDTIVSQCDLVYHLAAVVGVEHYVANPLRVLDVNVNGTQEILNAAYRHGKKVVYSSTSEVYGKNPSIPWSEDSDRVLGPASCDRWCYSTSKAVGEHFCHGLGKMGLEYVITRYFNVYGPRLDELDHGRVITIFIGKILAGEPITIVGDGEQTRCFTYIDDAINATINAGLLDAAVGGTFNIGTDVETTINELADVLVDISGSSCGVVHVSPDAIYGKSYEDVVRRVPDNSLMRNVLRVEPKTDLMDGMSKTYEWFKSEKLRKDTRPYSMRIANE